MDNWYRNGSVVVDGVEYAIWRNLGRNSWFVMEAAYGQISCDLVGEKDLAVAIRNAVDEYCTFHFLGADRYISLQQAEAALAAVRA